MARSSKEVPEKGWSEGAVSSSGGREPTTEWEELMSKTKSFDISKKVVWEAYQRVKANQGAAGVDSESLDFANLNWPHLIV